MLKVAFVDHYYGERIGGGEEYLLAVADGLKGSDFQSEIICLPQSSLSLEARKRALSTAEIPFYTLNLPVAISRLANYFSRQKFDIVNTHGYFSGIAGRLAAKRAGIKNIICTVHIEVRPNFPDTFASKMKFSIRNLLEKATSSGVRYIAVSKEIRGQIVEVGIDERAVTVIYPGIKPEPQHAAGESARDEGSLVFGSSGRLVPVKDYQSLLIAFSKLRQKGIEAELIIYGEGPERENLEKFAALLRVLKSVKLPGYQEKGRVYGSLDVFVLPSISEGFPMSLLEAAAYGIPCICTSAGGQKEIIENGKTGLIVPPKDPDSLARAMLWMANNYKEARKMGKAAQEFVLETFTLDRLIEEHARFFSDIVK